MSRLEEAVTLLRDLNKSSSSKARGVDILDIQYSLACDVAKLGAAYDEGTGRPLLLEAAELWPQFFETLKQGDPIRNDPRRVDMLVDARHEHGRLLFLLKRYRAANVQFSDNKKALEALPNEQQKVRRKLIQDTKTALAEVVQNYLSSA